MKKIQFLFLLPILIFNSCKKDDNNPLGSNDTAQIWHMVNDAGEIAEVVITPFTYSGTFSETDNSQHWYMSYPGGRMRIPVSGTISHTSQGDHWYFTITIQNGGVSLLGTGEGYSNGNFPDALTASGTVRGVATAPSMGSQNVNGSWTASKINGTTNTEVPPNPVLSSPADGVTNLSQPIVLSWSSCSGATSYTLQVSANNSFNLFVFNQSSLISTSKQINGLLNNTTYYWRVSATNSYGTSSYSTIRSFTTSSVGGSGSSCAGIPIVTYQGKVYNTVQVGTQCWLKENLNVGTRINISQNPSNNGTIEKYCYNDLESNCDTYGGLYQWNEAMGYSTTPGTKGICPDGFHVPTNAELQILGTAVSNNSNALKAIDQGTGSGAGLNTSGFSALLAGYRINNGTSDNLGGSTLFWSSTEYNTIVAYGMFLYFINSTINFYTNNKVYGYSVRCLKD